MGTNQNVLGINKKNSPIGSKVTINRTIKFFRAVNKLFLEKTKNFSHQLWQPKIGNRKFLVVKLSDKKVENLVLNLVVTEYIFNH